MTAGTQSRGRRGRIRLVATVIDRFSALSGGISILAMSALVTADVIGRYMLGHPTGIAVEVSGYLLVALIFLGLAHTERHDRHIAITVLTDRLPIRIQVWLSLATTLLSIVVVGWLTWFTMQPAMQDYALGTVSLTGTKTPQWIPQLAIPAGFALFTIELVRRAALQIVRLRGGSGERNDVL